MKIILEIIGFAISYISVGYFMFFIWTKICPPYQVESRGGWWMKDIILKDDFDTLENCAGMTIFLWPFALILYFPFAMGYKIYLNIIESAKTSAANKLLHRDAYDEEGIQEVEKLLEKIQ